ncbi:MAG: LysM peptidoglycan-binding domain-containing protein [Bacteroidetes bacterium]|nr:LysM peptidoglycan-binding domain-containing protein [Bacteroidota bacterium]
MKSKFAIGILLLVLVASQMQAYAQEEIKTENGKTYKMHLVANGETIYGLARTYKTSAKEIMAANGNLTTLKAGQKIKIPVASNASTTTVKPKESPKTVTTVTPPKIDVPVFHIVEQGETLNGIARKYSTTVEQIQQINELNDATISVGKKLFLSRGAKAKFEADQDAAELKKSQDMNPIKLNTAPVKNTDNAGTNEVEMPDNSLLHKRESGEAAWVNDADLNPNKYFALHRSAPTGTIMKVTNRMNNKFVFVKIIGKLPDTGDNQKLIIKLSQAAAQKLGVLDARFQADISYTSVSENK